MGKFHGVIAATTPSGSRVTSMSRPGRTDASFSPGTRSASPAKNLKICPARPTSPMASGSVLPSSRARRSPSSALRARISVPMKSSASARACGEATAQAGNAARAAAMAARACASPARAYSSITSVVSEGFTFREASSPSTQSPPIQFRFMAFAS